MIRYLLGSSESILTQEYYREIVAARCHLILPEGASQLNVRFLVKATEKQNNQPSFNSEEAVRPTWESPSAETRTE